MSRTRNIVDSKDYWTTEKLGGAQPVTAPLGTIDDLPPTTTAAPISSSSSDLEIPAPYDGRWVYSADDDPPNDVHSDRSTLYPPIPFIGKLYFTDDEGIDRYCTASYFGDKHILLTAGHCLVNQSKYNQTRTFSNYRFERGLNGDSAQQVVTQFEDRPYVYQRALAYDNPPFNATWDYGFLYTPTESTWDYVGWGIEYNRTRDDIALLAGYTSTPIEGRDDFIHTQILKVITPTAGQLPAELLPINKTEDVFFNFLGDTAIDAFHSYPNAHNIHASSQYISGAPLFKLILTGSLGPSNNPVLALTPCIISIYKGRYHDEVQAMYQQSTGESGVLSYGPKLDKRFYDLYMFARDVERENILI